ncbi:MAG: O-antigen ligase family protein, partial [Kiritimatiellaceae bacterium]|nr:O-antigen ligase family protein [Kiritimatiellaceae bacterium]
MKIFEKLVISVISLLLIASFTLYGVWEDKVGLFAPMVPVIYVALTLWLISSLLGDRSSKKGGASETNIQLSSLQIPPGGIPLLLFWLYSLVMIPFAVIPYEAKISCLRFGCYVGVYWASANILSRFPRRKAVWGTLCGVMVLVALYSLVQHKMNPEMLFGQVRYADYGARLGGTYICPNHIAHLFLMWIPFCLVFLFIPQFGWFWRICFGYAIPLFAILIYQTQSRAGLLGTLAAITTLVFLLILHRGRKAFYVALLIAPLLGAGLLGGLWAGSEMFRHRMQPVVKVLTLAGQGDWETVAAVDFRPMTWADASQLIKDNVWVGVGPGNYRLVFPEYRNRWKGARRETGHPHNEPIELLAEYGVIGFLLFLISCLYVVISLVHLEKTSNKSYHTLPAIALLAALVGTFVHGLFDFELRIFPNALMFALLAGCAVAPCLNASSAISPSRCRLNAAVRGIYVFVVLCVALLSVQVMASALLRVRGDYFREAEDRSTAEKMYRASVKVDPQNWWAYLGLGQIYSHYRYYELDPDEKKNWAGKEQAAFNLAYRHNVKKEEVVYGLGRTELALGNREAGIQHLRRAAHYKRFNDFYWRKLGIELRKAGLYDEALETFLY